MSLNARFGSRVKSITADAYKSKDPETRKPPSKSSIFKEGTEVFTPELDVTYAVRMLPEPDLDYIVLPLKTHYIRKTKSSFPCPKTKGDPCAVCNHGSELWAAGAQDAAKGFFPKDSAIARVVVRKEEEKGPQLIKFSYTNEKDIRKQMENPISKAILPVNDLEEGHDLYLKKEDTGKNPDGGKNTIKEVSIINFEPKASPIHTDEELVGVWIDELESVPIMSLINFKSEAEMLKLAGITEDGDEPEEQSSGAATTSASAHTSKSETKVEAKTEAKADTTSAAATESSSRLANLRSRMSGNK